MTRLTKLTLKNFKSFKKAEMPISKGFTAIVGSNGSGKSNILDALLFVLGITSLKTLRASKLTDLVNDECKESYAKVDLLLKDKETQYEISRMIDRQGKSVYRLDGKRTTLNEISSLLTDLGIDVTGHNIVAQGDVTRVIEMSAQERRSIIDNVAGLGEFDEKKDEAIKELDKVDSRIKEATIILNERTAFLLELEQEMNAAKEFSGLELEKRQIKATVIGRELFSLEKRGLELDNEVSELGKQKELVEKRLTELRTELVQTKADSAELNKKILTATEELYATVGREFEEKKAALMLEEEKIQFKKTLLEKDTEKVESNKKIIEEAQTQTKELAAKRKQFDFEHKELLKKIDEVSTKKSSVEKVVKSKNDDLRKLESELDSYNKSIEEARKEMFDLEVLVKQWDKQKAFNEKKLAELLAEEKELTADIKSIEEKKKKIMEHSKGKDLPKELSLLEKHLSELLEERNKATAQKENEEKAVSELKKALSKCPVCDSKLEESKKAQLLEQKKKLVEEHKSRAEANTKEISALKKNIDETKEKMILVARLLAEVAHEKTLVERINEGKKTIATLKKEVEAKTLDEQIARRNKLNEKLKVELTKRDAAKERLSAFRTQNIFEEYSTISKTYEDYLHKKSLLESALNEMNAKSSNISSICEASQRENAEISDELKKIRVEIKEKEGLMKELEGEVLAKEKAIETEKKKTALLSDEKERLDKRTDKAEKELGVESGKTRKIELRLNEFAIEKSRVEVRQNDLAEEFKQFEGTTQLSEKHVDDLKERLIVVEKRLTDIGAVNMKAVDNFNDLKKEVEDIQVKANKLAEERLAVLDMIDKIEVKRTSVFFECFNEINKNFQDMFLKFFNGEGNLALSEPDKPLESGLLIDAKQKAGKLQNIDSMSGGEKTLTALAFMFAIQLYKPAPFYAFDEADAALDKENSLKMGNLIEMIAEKSQFIAVTHNDVITKKADQIIGVARTKDNSSVIGLRLKNKGADDDEKVVNAPEEAKNIEEAN